MKRTALALATAFAVITVPSAQTADSRPRPGDRPAANPHGTRSAVLGRNGMIATSQPLASAAGLKVLQDGGNAIDAAVTAAAERCAGLPLIAGGKSFGGRMTSQAQAKAPLDGVKGLAFFGFPLHPAGKPSAERAAHLSDVKIPMLFLQGTRDALAEPDLLQPVVRQLGKPATLHLVKEADHSFHVLARSGRNDREVMSEVLDAFARWLGAILTR